MLDRDLTIISSRPKEVRISIGKIAETLSNASHDVWSRFLLEVSSNMMFGSCPDEVDWQERSKLISADLDGHEKQVVLNFIQILSAELKPESKTEQQD